MSLLKSSSIGALQNRSKKIVEVFTKTVDDLTKVNDEVKKAAEEKLAEKERLEKELASLSQIESDNLKVIGKIQNLLN